MTAAEIFAFVGMVFVVTALWFTIYMIADYLERTAPPKWPYYTLHTRVNHRRRERNAMAKEYGITPKALVKLLRKAKMDRINWYNMKRAMVDKRRREQKAPV